MNFNEQCQSYVIEYENLYFSEKSTKSFRIRSLAEKSERYSLEKQEGNISTIFEIFSRKIIAKYYAKSGVRDTEQRK